jgi:hypothetical protein
VKKIAEKDSKETARMAIARGLAAVVRRDLHVFLVDAGMAALQELLENERTSACGPAHARHPPPAWPKSMPQWSCAGEIWPSGAGGSQSVVPGRAALKATRSCYRVGNFANEDPAHRAGCRANAE